MSDGPSILNRRFRRYRRLWALGVLVAAMLLLRLGWGWVVGRQLNAYLAEIHARGEPVEVSDVVYKPVPDAANAWILQSQAAQALVNGVVSPSYSDLNYHDYPPYPPAWIKLAKASEQAHGPAFALARQARQRSEVQLRQRLTSPLANMMMPSLARATILGYTLADGALYMHLTGDDREAIERILDALHLSRSLRHDDFLSPQLMAIAIDGMVCHVTQVVAPGLRFNPAVNTHPAMRQKVNELINRLLDDELPRQALRRNLVMERLLRLDALRSESAGTWFIRPLADRQFLRMSPNLDRIDEAAGCVNWPQAQRILDQCTTEVDVSPTQGLWFRIPAPRKPRHSRWWALPSVSPQHVEQHFKILAERRATAISLACQLFRADHARWPDQLDQLVPDYLPAVPRDPYQSDGRAMGYLVFRGGLPDGGDRPLICFGTRQTNTPIPNEPIYKWIFPHSKEEFAQYRDVSRFAPPRSAKAVDHDPDKPDAPGDDAEKNQQAE